jgi:hypothetical protein
MTAATAEITDDQIVLFYRAVFAQDAVYAAMPRELSTSPAERRKLVEEAGDTLRAYAAASGLGINVAFGQVLDALSV